MANSITGCYTMAGPRQKLQEHLDYRVQPPGGADYGSPKDTTWAKHQQDQDQWAPNQDPKGVERQPGGEDEE